jgi:hypothetical protein
MDHEVGAGNRAHAARRRPFTAETTAKLAKSAKFCVG